MANDFEGATGDADVRFDGELKRIRELLPSITMEQETRSRKIQSQNLMLLMLEKRGIWHSSLEDKSLLIIKFVCRGS